MKAFLLIVLLAAVLAGLNAAKPLHVDDTTYYFDAAQIADHPFDPYGHVLLYFSDPLPALHILAPPVLPYWWAIAIRLFGERPVLWKLWLFPFALLFVSSLSALLNRFTARAATPLLITLVLSPVFLPGLNLMIDVPALALNLTAMRLFFCACDREAPALAVLAGLTAGLAMQTKYTALLAPAVLLIFSLLHHKMRLGLLAAGLAGLLFAVWETALFFRYGESHFIYQLLWGTSAAQPKSVLLGSLFTLLGGSAPTLGLLALTVLPAPRWLLLLAAGLAVLPFLLLLCPEAFSCGGRMYELANALFACNGAAALLSLGWAAWRLVQCKEQNAQCKRTEKTKNRFDFRSVFCAPHSALANAWFLVLWLALEFVGYVVISPFPAVRRIMGVTIAATLLIGCLAEQSQLGSWRRRVLAGLAAFTVLLGLCFFGVDYLEAQAEKQAAYDAAQQIRQEHPQATIWYAGYWGFQYYAEKCGMKQIVPLRNVGDATPVLLPPSHFHRGDWLVIPDENIPQQELDLSRPELQPKGQKAVNDAVPLATLMNYYAGAAPLRHRSGPRIVLHLFQVNDDFISR